MGEQIVGVVWCGVVCIRYNIWFLLGWCIVVLPGLMCNIFSNYGTLVGGKSSLSGATFGAFVGVLPKIIYACYGVYGVVFCNGPNHNKFFISIGTL